MSYIVRELVHFFHYNAKHGLCSESGQNETTRNSGSRLRQDVILFLLEFTLRLVDARTGGP